MFNHHFLRSTGAGKSQGRAALVAPESPKRGRRAVVDIKHPARRSPSHRLPHSWLPTWISLLRLSSTPRCTPSLRRASGERNTGFRSFLYSVQIYAKTAFLWVRSEILITFHLHIQTLLPAQCRRATDERDCFISTSTYYYFVVDDTELTDWHAWLTNAAELTLS